MVYIESRRDFEIYVDIQVEVLEVSKEVKEALKLAAMEGFDTGFEIRTNGGSFVKVRDE